jgi:hypothetical protein
VSPDSGLEAALDGGEGEGMALDDMGANGSGWHVAHCRLLKLYGPSRRYCHASAMRKVPNFNRPVVP